MHRYTRKRVIYYYDYSRYDVNRHGLETNLTTSRRSVINSIPRDSERPRTYSFSGHHLAVVGLKPKTRGEVTTQKRAQGRTNDTGGRQTDGRTVGGQHRHATRAHTQNAVREMVAKRGDDAHRKTVFG